MRVTEEASTHGLNFDVDDMIVKMTRQDQTKMLHIKQQLATIDHTPDHPVYPVMVREAIMDLNEEGGSTMDSISRFIMRKYDVFWVVHVAKLIQQLDKLVEKEEIVFTSENRYMLPTEDSGSKLKQGKQQCVQYEPDQRSNKLQKVNEGVEVQEGQNAIVEMEDQPGNDKAKESQAAQSEGFEYQNHSQEDQVRVYAEERLELTTEKIAPKLIEQLDKPVEKEEIVFTSENRYMLPAEDSGSPAKLKQGKQQSVQYETDQRSNKLQKVNEGVEVQEGQNAIVEIEDQPGNDKAKESQAAQSEGVEYQNHSQEDQARVYEEERLELTTEKIAPKLIEQLDKPVEKEEIVFTSENCYMLPAEDSGSPAKLKQGKQQCVQYEPDQRSNKLQKVNEGVEVQEGQNAIVEIEDQPGNDKAKESQAAQSEGVEYQNDSQEDQVRVYEEERLELTTEKIAPKLIEQLDKPVEKEEIVFTSENRCMLPAEDSGSPAKLKQGKQQCVQYEPDQRSNKLQKVNEGVEVQEGQNAILEIEDQPRSDKVKESQAAQSEGVEYQNHSQEDQVRVYEEERLELTTEKIAPKLFEQLDKPVAKEEIVFTSENRYMLPAEDSVSPAKLKQGKQQSVQYETDQRSNKLQKVNEGVEVQEGQNAIVEIEDQPGNDKAKESQAAQSEGVEYQNHSQEDQVRVYEEERLEMTTEIIAQVVEGQSEVIVEERYQQPAEEVDEGRPENEVHIQMSKTEAIEERSQLLQELQVTEDQVETKRQSKVTIDLHNVEHPENEEIIGKTRPQVPQDLYFNEHSQSEKIHVRTIPMQIGTRGKELRVIEGKKALQEQDNEVGSNSTDISHTSEITAKPFQDKTMIAMPGSSQTSQQLDHVGSSLLFHTLKEKCINACKMITEAKHELMDVFSFLKSMEVAASIRESRPKALSHSDYVPTDPMQLGQNQQIELPKLKRTAEVEITSLQEPFQNQKRQALPGNHDLPLKYRPESISVAPTQQIMDSQQLEVEKLHDFPSSKGHLQLHDPEKWSKSCPVAGSFNFQELNLEQRLEHHSTTVEFLQTPVILEHVELEQRLDVLEQKRALGKNLSIEKELTPAEDITIYTDQVEPGRPPGFEVTVEQLSKERLQCAVPSCDAKKLESVLVKEQKLEVSVKERHTEVEMTISEQQCQIKQQIQGEELRPREQRASNTKYESRAAGVTYDQQLHNIETLQDPKQILVVHESSQLMNQQKKGCDKRKKVDMELPPRELRCCGRKKSESNPTHPTDANDVGLNLSFIKLDRQQKLDHPIPERPQKKRPKKVEKSFQSVEWELTDQGKKRHLRSQLAPVTSDEVQSIENPKQHELTTAGDSIQTQQKLQLQPRVQCSSQGDEIVDKTIEESQPLPDQYERESQLGCQRRGRSPKLKPDMDSAKGKILPVDGQDHHKELPSHIEGRRPQPKISTIVSEISSSHQTPNEQQPKKNGRGRPSKSISAASQSINIPLCPKNQLKQKEQQLDRQQKQKWRNSAGQGRFTRSKSASVAETISSLLPQDR